MAALEKSILATLAYFDVLDFPLTVREVTRFLINPEKFVDKKIFTRKKEELGYGQIEEVLQNLKLKGLVEEFLGFYFLPGKKHIYLERIERIKLAEEKWKKARRYLFWIQSLPFIELVLASGSLAMGHMTENSDLDMLIVAKSGRIWTARLFVYVLFGIMGVRRRKEQIIAPDKICPNHFITTRSLRIPCVSLYTAQLYAHLIPVYVRRKEVLDDFWRENTWIENYLQNWEHLDGYQYRHIQENKFLQKIASLAEVVLNFMFRGKLENWARALQRSRVQLNLPGRITMSDQQLEFHPNSAEGRILQKYNKTIDSWKEFGSYLELDSGLN
ncbi:MAG: hypothetical protein Q7S32_02960 [bacterium]|nr:hypothetical protein [bacterium]